MKRPGSPSMERVLKRPNDDDAAASDAADTTLELPPAQDVPATSAGEEEDDDDDDDDDDGYTLVVNRRKPPPIFVNEVADIFALLEELGERLEGEYSAEAAGEAIRIKTTTVADHGRLRTILGERTVVVDRQRSPAQGCCQGSALSYRRRAAYCCPDENGVSDEKAERLRSRRPDRTRPLPIMLVTLQDCERNRQLREVASLRGLTVKVEAYRPPRGPTQCRNCLRFGHVQRDCHLQPHSRQCAGQQENVACPLGANPPPDARKCSNCGGDSHGALFLGYPAYQRACSRRPYLTLLALTSPTISHSSNSCYNSWLSLMHAHP